MSDLRYRHTIRRLHVLGPRPVGELLLDLQREHDISDTDLARLLERYAALPADFLRLNNGDDWPAEMFAVERAT
ncbi:MAG: hypothetical protein RIM84_24590 [Alphaproteobacteria bacterium]